MREISQYTGLLYQCLRTLRYPSLQPMQVVVMGHMSKSRACHLSTDCTDLLQYNTGQLGELLKASSTQDIWDRLLCQHFEKIRSWTAKCCAYLREILVMGVTIENFLPWL